MVKLVFFLGIYFPFTPVEENVNTNFVQFFFDLCTTQPTINGIMFEQDDECNICNIMEYLIIDSQRHFYNILSKTLARVALVAFAKGA